jgi:opacity protein-like surface antigen
MKIFTKSKLMIAAFTMAAAFGAQAQVLSGSVIGGFNMSNISGISISNQGINKSTSRSSVGGGISFRYDTENKWAVSLGLIYSPKGADYSGTVNDSTSEHVGTSTFSYQDVTNYLDIPLLVHYNFMSSTSKFRPYATLGIYTGIRLNGKTTLDYSFKGKINGMDSSYKSSPEIRNYYDRNNVDYGVVAGAGLNYDITSKLMIGVDVRYNAGLVDIREIKLANTSQKNSNINVLLSVGYKLWSDVGSAPAGKPEEKK